MPRFVIVIPSSDSAATLRSTLRSALAQQFSDYAVYCSDNASSDGTSEIFSQFNSPQLHCVRHETRVPKTENWNRTYRGAPDCEWLVNLHSDDLLAPTCLADLSQPCQDVQNVLVYGGIKTLTFAGEPSTKQSYFPLDHTCEGERQQLLLLLGNIVPVVGFAIRREAFEAVGGWDEKWNFMQDMEMWMRLADRGRSRYRSRLFGFYRDPPPSSTGEGQAREYLRWQIAAFKTARSARHQAAIRGCLRKYLANFDRTKHGFVTEVEPFASLLAEARSIALASGVCYGKPIMTQRFHRLVSALSAPLGL